MTNYAVIMAGGNGTRLFPFSTPERPKFLLPLKSDKPIIEDIYDTLSEVFGAENVFICTRSEKVELIKNAVKKIPHNKFIQEPDEFSGTFKTCEYCLEYLSRDGDSNVLFCGADALISDEEIFKNALKEAVKQIEKAPKTIVFGHIPKNPNTNFGYVKAYLHNGGVEFHEKPSKKVAELLLKEGGWYWNMGLTFINSSVFKKSVEKIKQVSCSNISDGQSIDKAFLERHYFHTSPLKLIKINSQCWEDIGLLENLKSEFINKKFVKVFNNKKGASVVVEYHNEGYDLKGIINEALTLKEGQTLYVSKFGKKIQ